MTIADVLKECPPDQGYERTTEICWFVGRGCSPLEEEQQILAQRMTSAFQGVPDVWVAVPVLVLHENGQPIEVPRAVFMAVNDMHWVSVDDALPEHRQAVLVRYARDNWLSEHTVAGGHPRQVWRWQAAMFYRGRTADEVKAAGGLSRFGDEAFNNLRPYAWQVLSGCDLFGQDVTHWAAITDPCQETP